MLRKPISAQMLAHREDVMKIEKNKGSCSKLEKLLCKQVESLRVKTSAAIGTQKPANSQHESF